MNHHILDNVMQVSENISLPSVVLLILITLVVALLLIALCNGGLLAVKRLWHRVFDHKTEGGSNHD